MRLLLASAVLAGSAALTSSALAQQDFPAEPLVNFEQVQATPSGTETALEYALREGWADEAAPGEMPAYVRAATQRETQEGPGFSMPFCGPWTPACP